MNEYAIKQAWAVLRCEVSMIYFKHFNMKTLAA